MGPTQTRMPIPTSIITDAMVMGMARWSTEGEDGGHSMAVVVVVAEEGEGQGEEEAVGAVGVEEEGVAKVRDMDVVPGEAEGGKAEGGAGGARGRGQERGARGAEAAVEDMDTVTDRNRELRRRGRRLSLRGKGSLLLEDKHPPPPLPLPKRGSRGVWMEARPPAMLAYLRYSWSGRWSDRLGCAGVLACSP